MEIQVHNILPLSQANGPGMRSVVWLQGCRQNCAGCFNPLTHNVHGGRRMEVHHLYDLLMENETSAEGISISGGEPFLQSEALAELLGLLRKHSELSLLVFSGYELEEIQQNPLAAVCLDLADVLICGPYRKDLPPAYERFCSSANQRLILLTDRYSVQDFSDLPLAEYVIDAKGMIQTSGICFK